MSNSKTNDVPTLRSVCETLVDVCETTFIAAHEQVLATQFLDLRVHTPPGTDLETSIPDRLHQNLGQFDHVEFAGRECFANFRPVLHGDVHIYRQVPLYARGHRGIEDTTLDEGIADARTFLDGDAEPVPLPSKTIDLDVLVRELADVGACAVELNNEIFVKDGFILLHVLIPSPPKGHSTTGPYTSVSVDDDEYDLQCVFTCSGPGRHGLIRTPLYLAGEVSVDEGMSNFGEVKSIAAEADSLREASPPQPKQSHQK